jgi:hypothetical protein
MATTSTKYNPIATVGSNRYNPISTVSAVPDIFAATKPYQPTADQQKSYPTPAAEPKMNWFDSLKSGIEDYFTGYTPKEKTMMSPADTKKAQPTSPYPVKTISTVLGDVKTNVQPVTEPNIYTDKYGNRTDLSKIGSVKPFVPDKSLTISTAKPEIPTPEAQAWQTQKQQEADILNQKIEAAKIAPDEYFQRGMSFGYAGNVGYDNKAPAVTLSQKGMELAGSIVGWMTLGKFLGPVAGAVTEAIPGGEAAVKVATDAMQKSVITRNIFNPVNAAKAYGTGFVGGLISKASNINERVQNALSAGKTFLAFDTLAYPVTSFFRPVWYKMGNTVEGTKVAEQAKSMLPDGTTPEQVFSQPKEVYFKNPDDPSILLKVTTSTSGKAVLDVVPDGYKGVEAKTVPDMTKVQVEMFKSEPSLYNKLVTFLSGWEKSAGIPEGAIPGEVTGAAPATDIAQSQPVETNPPATSGPISQAASAAEPGVAQSIFNANKPIINNEVPGSASDPINVPSNTPATPPAITTPGAVSPTGKQTIMTVDGSSTIPGIPVTPENTKVPYNVVDGMEEGKTTIAAIEKKLTSNGVSYPDIQSIVSRLPRIDGVTFTDNIPSAINDHNIAVRDLGKTTTKPLASESTATQGPGYQGLTKRLDTMVKNNTIRPEDATILKTLFEGTNDKYLSLLNIGENARMRTSGRFSAQTSMGMAIPYTNKLNLRKGLVGTGNNYATAEPAKVFAHEYGHAGYYLILTNSERQIVDTVYSQMKRTGRINLFEGGLSGKNGSASYYAKNPQEFFAESFANYVFENKLPALQMEPLLRKLGVTFFDALKRLVFRKEEAAVMAMRPLFEKILKGDKTTPLSDFSSPPSFKKDLQALLEKTPRPAEPNANGIFVKPQSPTLATSGTNRPAKIVTPTFSKSTPLPTEGAPIDLAAKILETAKANLPPDIPIDPLEKVMMGSERTPMEERVRFLDYLRTPWKIFERMKIRPQYERLLSGYEGYVKELPKNIDKITAWSKQVPAASNERIFRALDGEKISLTPEETKVAGEIKTWLSEWADRLGMKPDARISEYITHIFPLGKGGEIPEEISFLINKKIPGSVYNPFLLQRQGAEGYLKNTWKALDAYVKRATRKVNMDPALAELKAATSKMTDTSQLNYLNRYLGAVNLRPTELDTLIDNHIKERVGYLFGARPTAAITRFVRMMISRAKIGGSMTSFAKNLTQGVNTYAELGTRYTMKGYLDLVRYGGKELKENGALIAPFIEDRTYSAVKKMAEKFDNVLFLNMTASEMVNRGAAYYGAKAKFLNGRTTPKEYREAFGKPMPAGYTPTMEDAIHYGKFVAGKTQFLFGPLDTPVGLNSDIAKMAAQFQSFGLKQSEFIIEMIGQRNWWKLVRYLVSSMLLFSYIGSAFGMKWTDSWMPLRFGMPPAIQFGIDTFNAITGAKDQYGNVPSVSSRLRTVGNSLFTNVVPGGAQIKRTYEGLKAVSQGASRGSPTKAHPQGAYQYSIPSTPMNYVRAGLFGKSYTDQGQSYYNKSTPKSSGSSSSRYNPI